MTLNCNKEESNSVLDVDHSSWDKHYKVASHSLRCFVFDFARGLIIISRCLCRCKKRYDCGWCDATMPRLWGHDTVALYPMSCTLFLSVSVSVSGYARSMERATCLLWLSVAYFKNYVLNLWMLDFINQ